MDCSKPTAINKSRQSVCARLIASSSFVKPPALSWIAAYRMRSSCFGSEFSQKGRLLPHCSWRSYLASARSGSGKIRAIKDSVFELNAVIMSLMSKEEIPLMRITSYLIFLSISSVGKLIFSANQRSCGQNCWIIAGVEFETSCPKSVRYSSASPSSPTYRNSMY